jgi:hypothetical protein
MVARNETERVTLASGRAAGDPGRSFLLFGWANRNGFVGNYNNVSKRFLHAL